MGIEEEIDFYSTFLERILWSAACLVLDGGNTLDRLQRQIIDLGGGFSMEPDESALDLYVLEQARLPRPAVCFLATARGDASQYILNFYTTMEKPNGGLCCTSFLGRASSQQVWQSTMELRHTSWVIASSGWLLSARVHRPTGFISRTTRLRRTLIR
jgi:hypothetical protein